MAISTNDFLNAPKIEGDADPNAAYISSLIRERAGANADVAAIDAELKRLGANGKPPAKRATKLKKEADSK